MKYNCLLSFIYIKDFRRLYLHGTTTPNSTQPHSAQHQRSTTASAKFTSSRKNKCPQGAKKERKHQKKERKLKKLKLQHFKKWRNLYKIVLKNEKICKCMCVCMCKCSCICICICVCKCMCICQIQKWVSIIFENQISFLNFNF